MRRLFLIRHAKTEAHGARDDFERRLTERGRADARSIAAALAARKTLPQTLVHSGAARAKETAEIFAAEWKRKVALRAEFGLYDASLASLLALTRALPNDEARVGLVGHNPGLGELAAALTGSGAALDMQRLAAKYPTGAVAVLDFSARDWGEVGRNTGTLGLYLTPAELDAGTD